MIPSVEGLFYFEGTKLPALLREISPKHHNNFYCLNCLHSFGTENWHESHKDFCNVGIPSEDTTILELNQNQKSNKAPSIICADLKWLIEMIDGCNNNPQKNRI